MKRIGIIGGIGPESTLDYYRRIITTFQGGPQAFSVPEIIIYSANLAELMKIQEAGRSAELTAWLLERVEALHRAGAELAAIAANTPHMVFDEVSSRAPIPMLSIVESTCSRAQELGLRKLGLMGTAVTMKADFYPRAFRAKGLAVVVPEEDDQALIHHRLFSEIELGIIRDSTRQELLAVVRRMIDRQAIDGLILGCTELPLVLERDEFGIPFLNTTALHVASIVRRCREG